MKFNKLFFDKYDNIISLGCNCEVKHAILRRLWIDSFGNDLGFSLRSDRLPKSVISRYYFDWSWSKNTIDSVIAVLDYDFDLSFTSDNITFFETSNGRLEVMHKITKMIYPHDFTYDNNILIKSSVENELQLVNHKMHAIAQKTLSCFTDSSRILFVLYDNSPFDDVLKLIEKIESKFPMLEFDLLWVFNDNRIKLHKIIYNNHIVFKYKVNKVNSPGDLDGWFNAFDEVAKLV